MIARGHLLMCTSSKVVWSRGPDQATIRPHDHATTKLLFIGIGEPAHLACSENNVLGRGSRGFQVYVVTEFSKLLEKPVGFDALLTLVEIVGPQFVIGLLVG